jgi:Ser/Thr protein kinase RdoA (MazF antagonist)
VTSSTLVAADDGRDTQLQPMLILPGLERPSMLDNGEVAELPLRGGNNTEHVVRVGETVRRARGHRAEEGAGLLRYLEAVGFAHAPRFLGIDEHGRDILTYIPGETTDHPSQRAPGAYRQAGRMLRELHDATTGQPWSGGHECVVHGDPGPFNTICQRGWPVALIDWDSSGPGERLDDLAYMAWTWCIQSLGRVAIVDQARRLRELRDGYGEVLADELVEAIVRRQTLIVTTESLNRLDSSKSTARRRHAERAVAWAAGDRELVKQHQHTFLEALS